MLTKEQKVKIKKGVEDMEGYLDEILNDRFCELIDEIEGILDDESGEAHGEAMEYARKVYFWADFAVAEAKDNLQKLINKLERGRDEI